MLIKKVACDKNPNKVCPQKEAFKVTKNGAVSCSAKGYLDCCKSQNIMKELERLVE